MIITCPSCSTRFVVAPAAIGKTGRRVRCAKCRHVWFAEPAGPDHEIAPEKVIRDDQGAAAGTSAPGGAEEGSAEDILRGRKLPKRTQLPAIPSAQSRPLIIGWIALAIFIGGTVAAMMIWRDAIVDAWPASERLYQGFSASDAPQRISRRISYLRRTIEFTQDIEVLDRGIRLDLLIRGTLVNAGARSEDLPRIRGILRNGDQAQIYEWSFRLPEDQIAPGQEIEFEESVEDIPREAQSVELFLLWQELPEFTRATD